MDAGQPHLSIRAITGGAGPTTVSSDHDAGCSGVRFEIAILAVHRHRLRITLG
jgi:hypothetical protein